MAKLRIYGYLSRDFLADAGDTAVQYYAHVFKCVATRDANPPAPATIAERDFRSVAATVLDCVQRDDVQHPSSFEPFRGAGRQKYDVLMEVPEDLALPMQVLRIEASVPPVEAVTV